MNKFITTSKAQTQKLGEALAKELRKGVVICLSGDLGTGKTTFTQGFLKGLKIKGSHTSPTFVIIKQYRITQNIKNKTLQAINYNLQTVYHIDAYRIKDKDLLELGWKEIIADNPPAGGNVIIIEWAERVRKIIPKNAIWIKFKWLDESKRELKFS